MPIPMNPREPLTQKAKAAIQKYVVLKSQKTMPLIGFLIEYTLEAERMKRDDLYKWLEKKGYFWLSSAAMWANEKKANKTPPGGYP